MKLRVTQGEFLFTLSIAAYVIVLLILSFGYAVESRLFPLLVLVPTMVFLALRFISMTNPRLSRILEPEAGMIDIEKIQRLAQTADERKVMANRREEFKVILWTISLVALVYLLGILPAIALFVFLFVRFYGRKKVVASVVYTLATWIFVYIIFVAVLQARLYTGILDLTFFD